MGRRRGPGLTRDQVVATALAIVRAEGAEALGVSRVARELGIKPPSIYNHVGSGDALAEAVVLMGHREVGVALADAVRGIDAADAQLRALAGAARAWALDNQGVYALMSRIEPDNEHPDFVPVFQRTMDLFARPLGQLGVPRERRVHAIRGLRAAIHGFVLLESTGQFQLAEDRAESFGWLVETLIRGVREP